jgi:PhnB protein
MGNVSPVPEGMHSLTPHITVSNAAKAIDFYKQAFGAKEIDRSTTPQGKIMHAVLQIGDSRIMLNDEFPEMRAPRAPAGDGNLPFAINFYTEDTDATIQRATAAGAKVTMPAQDMFWGDRYGQIVDPFGYRWAVATRKENLSRDEINRRAAAMFAA